MIDQNCHMGDGVGRRMAADHGQPVGYGGLQGASSIMLHVLCISPLLMNCRLREFCPQSRPPLFTVMDYITTSNTKQLPC